MSDQPNRIAALLNSRPAATPPSATTAAPGTVSYDIKPGQDASADQLGIDSTPDALISVDGHQVASGDNGLSVDIAPDGSTHVTHGPQDATPPGDGQVQGGPYEPVSDSVPGQNPAQDPGGDGAQPVGDTTGAPGAPTTGDAAQSGAAQDGTQPLDNGGSPPGGPAGTTQDPSQPDTPIEHLDGIGPHAAHADLAVFGPGTHPPATVTHQNPDGSLDITIPKGQDNPHAITVHVTPNDDGSLDITVPKSAANPHEIKVHVQPDKHLDLNITQDKDGHLKIDAHDHAPDQKEDWPGLKQPAGQAPQPGEDPAAGDPMTPDVPKMPEAPKTPGGGAPPGAGGDPSGAGGGMPGGGSPGGSGGGKNTPLPKKQPSPAPTSNTGYASIRQESIRDLGKDIDAGPVQTMNKAQQDAPNINVGFPGFGIAGKVVGLNSAATDVRDASATTFGDGHTALSKWTPKLSATATTWQNAELDSSNKVNKLPH
jgi:hypothetical protein